MAPQGARCHPPKHPAQQSRPGFLGDWHFLKEDIDCVIALFFLLPINFSISPAASPNFIISIIPAISFCLLVPDQSGQCSVDRTWWALRKLERGSKSNSNKQTNKNKRSNQKRLLLLKKSTSYSVWEVKKRRVWPLLISRFLLPDWFFGVSYRLLAQSDWLRSHNEMLGARHALSFWRCHWWWRKFFFDLAAFRILSWYARGDDVGDYLTSYARSN